MVQRTEDLAAICPLTFKDGGRIVKRMRQDVDFAVPPRHEFPIHPDITVTVVISRHNSSALLACTYSIFAFISEHGP